MKSDPLLDPINQGAYFYKMSNKIKELPELERRIIENLPMDANLLAALNSEEEYAKPTYEHGMRRRIGNNFSSPF